MGKYTRPEPGAGIALLFIIIGLIATLTGLLGYVVPVTRRAESILREYVEPDGVMAGETRPESEPVVVSGT